MTLTEFLLARIAEDEADAHRAVQSPWAIDDSGCCVFAPEGQGDDIATMAWQSAGHIARWQPARVLAECEAKRLIARLYQESVKDYDNADVDTSDLRSVVGQAVNGGTRDGLLAAVELLALPYADHPDYDPEWRA